MSHPILSLVSDTKFFGQKQKFSNKSKLEYYYTISIAIWHCATAGQYMLCFRYTPTFVTQYYT